MYAAAAAAVAVAAAVAAAVAVAVAASRILPCDLSRSYVIKVSFHFATYMVYILKR